MPRTTIVPNTLVGPYPALQPAADSLDVTRTAADASNLNQCAYTGREIILAHNTGAVTRNITFTSKVDEKNRTGDITNYQLQAGNECAHSFVGGLDGWRQTDNMLYFQADHAEVIFRVLRLP